MEIDNYPILIPPPIRPPRLIRQMADGKVHVACICDLQPLLNHPVVRVIGGKHNNPKCRGCSCQCPYTLVGQCH